MFGTVACFTYSKRKLSWTVKECLYLCNCLPGLIQLHLHNSSFLGEMTNCPPVVFVSGTRNIFVIVVQHVHFLCQQNCF